MMRYHPVKPMGMHYEVSNDCWELQVPVSVILLRWMSLSVRYHFESCTVASSYRVGNYPAHKWRGWDYIWARMDVYSWPIKITADIERLHISSCPQHYCEFPIVEKSLYCIWILTEIPHSSNWNCSVVKSTGLLSGAWCYISLTVLIYLKINSLNHILNSCDYKVQCKNVM